MSVTQYVSGNDESRYSFHVVCIHAPSSEFKIAKGMLMEPRQPSVFAGWLTGFRHWQEEMRTALLKRGSRSLTFGPRVVLRRNNRAVGDLRDILSFETTCTEDTVDGTLRSCVIADQHTGFKPESTT